MLTHTNWDWNDNSLVEKTGSVWVIEIGVRYDRGVYRIFDSEEQANEVYDFCLEAWPHLYPALTEWSLNGRRFDRCSTRIKPELV
jgi:hypothetical protein